MKVSPLPIVACHVAATLSAATPSSKKPIAGTAAVSDTSSAVPLSAVTAITLRHGGGMTKPSTSADEAGATWLRLASGSTSAAVDARRAALPLAAAREGRLTMMLMLHVPRRMASSRHFQRAAERAACGDSSRRSGSMSMSRCQSDTAGGYVERCWRSRRRQAPCCRRRQAPCWQFASSA